MRLKGSNSRGIFLYASYEKKNPDKRATRGLFIYHPVFVELAWLRT